MFPFELACQFFNRGREDPHALLRDILAPFSNDAFVAVSDRVRHDDDRKARVTYPLPHNLRERRERGANHRHSGNTKVFECGRVTRGPRRRRPSVADTVNDRVTLRSHLLRIGRRNTKISLPPELDFRDSVLTMQDFYNATEHNVGKLLAIIQDADARTAQRR